MSIGIIPSKTQFVNSLIQSGVIYHLTNALACAHNVVEMGAGKGQEKGNV